MRTVVTKHRQQEDPNPNPVHVNFKDTYIVIIGRSFDLVKCYNFVSARAIVTKFENLGN